MTAAPGRSSPNAPDALYADRTRRLDWARVRDAARARWWAAAALAIAWVTWPYPSLATTSGTDQSWAIALHLAADRGLDFGREILFTYGPLGFLSQPVLVTTPTAALAFAFALAMQVALCALVLRSALRAFPAPAAVLLTYAAVAILAATGFSNLADYGTFLVALLAVRALERESLPAWLLVAGGALAALQLLVKTNGGIVCLVLLALVAWRLRPGGWRSEAVLGGSFSVAVVLLWLASGSSLAALPSWLRESFHVVVSYTDAQASDVPNRDRPLALALLAIAAALVVAQARWLGRRRGLALAAVALVLGVAYLKEGFIRDDSFHSTLFFAALALSLLAVRWRPELRWGAAAVVVASVGAAAASVNSAAFAYRLGSHARNAVDQARVLVDGSRRRSTLASSRADARRRLAVDAATLRRLRGHTVDVQPYEASAVWAYGLAWRPQLFIQSYMATDHALDLDNAHRLERHGAARILRQREPTYAIDGKHPFFLAPESFLAVTCNYVRLRATAKWEVLGRAADRCGQSTLLRSVEARAGETVQVPAAPGRIVYARLHAHETAKQRLRSLLLKPLPLPRILVDGTPFRLVPDTARGPLVLRLPQAVGLGAVAHSRLAVENVASPYRVDFFALTFTKS